jgi:hypothetical protein
MTYLMKFIPEIPEFLTRILTDISNEIYSRVHPPNPDYDISDEIYSRDSRVHPPNPDYDISDEIYSRDSRVHPPNPD